MKLLASTEGIFTETAGGVALAATKKLIEAGKINRDESIVVLITGNGMKTIEAFNGHLREPHIIDPRLKSFTQLMESI